MEIMRPIAILPFAAPLALLACLVPQKPAPPVFGGQGASVSAGKETPLPAASAEPKPSGPCAAAAPPGDFALIDDFEDGDNKPFKAFQREGWWYGAGDATEGGKMSPPSGQFAPVKLPAAQATKTNLLAAHLTAEGYRQWGAVWGTSLNWSREGIRCPFNASAFAGVKFRAKGPGLIRVTFGMPETQPVEYGGVCKTNCYDSHGTPVLLADKWDDYVVPWEVLQQGGWGAEARFDPARILSLNFAVLVKDLPSDFWLDDVKFLTQAEAAEISKRSK
jgi:hypothetical protein